jgi:integrase
MKYLCQRPGRKGWYVRYPVERQHRAQVGRNAIERKAGDTLQEARKAMHQLIADIQQEIAVKVGTADQLTTWKRTFGPPEQLKPSERLLLINEVDLADPTAVTKLDAYLQNARTYQQLFDERVVVEQPRPSTQRSWQNAIKNVVTLTGNEYPHTVTVELARKLRNELLSKVSHGTTRSCISALKGFWSFGIANGYLKENPWQGLTRKLDQAVKHKLPEQDLISEAVTKAFNGNDIRFLIMHYTGCRSSEANGLRYSDVNLEDGTVTFTEWTQEGLVRRLKGGLKDERTVPLHTALWTHLKGLRDIRWGDSTDPIWPNAYKAREESWGAGWSGSFKTKYCFVSHDLRRAVVTKLAVAGVSPFVINAITRQRIPGLSAVVELYVRPSTEDLRAAIQLLT